MRMIAFEFELYMGSAPRLSESLQWLELSKHPGNKHLSLVQHTRKESGTAVYLWPVNKQGGDE